MYTHTHLYIHTHTYACMHRCLHECIHTHKYKQAGSRTDAYRNICLCRWVCVGVHISDIHTIAYIHTYPHAPVPIMSIFI